MGVEGADKSGGKKGSLLQVGDQPGTDHNKGARFITAAAVMNITAASVKITGNAKSALEMIQTEICSRHGHCGEPTAGRDSKTEAMFLSFFLQMSNLMVLNGRRDRAGKNQRSEINSSKHQRK